MEVLNQHKLKIYKMWGSNSDRFGSKMAAGYFQRFLSVLKFYSHLIGIKNGLHFSNQVKIKIVFKELIYLNKNIKKKNVFGPKCACNLIHKYGPQNLMVTMVRSLCCYIVNILLNGHYYPINTTQKMKFSIKDFLSKREQIRRNLRIWSHLLKKSLMENFIFDAVKWKFFNLIR